VSEIILIRLYFLQENFQSMKSEVTKLQQVISDIIQGGGPEAVARHIQRGKLTARDRINYVIDEGSPFLELSQLAGHEMYGKDVIPAGGIITGIGRIEK